MKRVFIVSEVRLYREGLARLLRPGHRLEVVGAAEDVPAALAELAGLDEPPEAVLLDIPAPAGLEGLAQLGAAVPTARIIVLNVSDRDEQTLIAWAEAGVGGLLARDVGLDDIAQAVQTTVSGGTVCSPRLAALLLERLARSPEARPVSSPLTSREREIAALLEQGMFQQGDRCPPADRAADGQEPRPQHPHQAEGQPAGSSGGDAARRALKAILAAHEARCEWIAGSMLA
jgi:two-component system, NarL family, nitrate/nitrite response regulator NarL